MKDVEQDHGGIENTENVQKRLYHCTADKNARPKGGEGSIFSKIHFCSSFSGKTVFLQLFYYEVSKLVIKGRAVPFCKNVKGCVN